MKIQTILDGYYSKSECENIKNKMQGKSFYKFDISYSNLCGNCKLIISSDIDGYTQDELKQMFIYCCISELAKEV